MQASLYLLRICCKKLEGGCFTNEFRRDAESEGVIVLDDTTLEGLRHEGDRVISTGAELLRGSGSE